MASPLRIGTLIAALAADALPALGAPAESAPDFNTEIRPILSRYCLKCHGPDEKTRKGGLRLDLAEEATKPAKSGDRAIVPHDPEGSEALVRILSKDPDEIMPPPETKQELSEEQKAAIKRWIAAGAKYDRHWAFVPPQKAQIPGNGAPAAANPIDAFVDARLASAGLRRSEEANRAILIRRVSLDLIGLPPYPEEVRAFETDQAPDAYERLVDRLLASPHYGERWARRWLDLARYADTNGYEKDRTRSIWPYRDWVVRALNADMPFDQFTIEQLAGDLLPNPTRDQLIATGFHRNTMLNEEGGIDPLEFRYHAMTDRVATTGTTWLGLTLGCAQCHTHKYDPITHREYFGIFAFLNNADELEIDLPPADFRHQLARREARLQELIAALPSKWPAAVKEPLDQAFQRWLEKERTRTAAWQPLHASGAKSNLPLLTPEPDGSIFASGDITKDDTYQLTYPAPGGKITAIRLEALPDERLPAHGPGMCYYEGPKGDFFLGEFEVEADGAPVRFASASESHSKNNFGKNPATAASAIDGDPQTGWSCADRPGERHEAVFILAQPVEAKSLKVKMRFGRHYACSLGRFRISTTQSSVPAEARGFPPEIESLLLADPHTPVSSHDREKLRNYFLVTAPELAPATKEIRELQKPPRFETTLVFRERPPANPRPTFIHHRGEYLQAGDPVTPGVLGVLNPLPADQKRDRLAFARWLVSRDNPLSARVAVNRAWAAFFGRGLVRTLDDFGYQGASPTHPELLDWLAVEFMDQGWSMKAIHRLIVTSATYRQASVVPELSRARDPENKWLSHFPRVRLEAEIIRDSALRASGLLSMKIGGPPVKPPQPEGVSEVAYGSPKWEASAGEDRYRRSLYTFAKRTAPYALYNTFDAPTGEACVPRRDVSDTPLQALTLMNDIVFTEASRALAKVLVFTLGDDDAKLTAAFERVLGRRPNPAELPTLRAFVKAQRTRFTSRELDPQLLAGTGADAELAAWTALARALFNLDEATTRS